ncbi:uncharacterized protein LOC112502647 [Cynara cardunculus var. scolymus]|uniref:uncharacterized protein LOC112502647 n=1 Tax=Cynara cardunculus var. scolymus TaxID=59895 RepID=UPI000D626258|nr:uncharacterized protein LOC112502647 [Cynara cardunculus var. scolymus]
MDTRWADKVKFMLMVVKLYYVLDPSLPLIPEDPVPELGKQPDLDKIADLEKLRLICKKEETLVCGHIKNALSDCLYDLYFPITCPRELWKALKFNYKSQEDGTNKYLVSQYLRFQMVDEKQILEQVHELQVFVNKLKMLSIAIPEIFQVGAVIDKLLPFWKHFSKRMMYKTEDYSLDELLKHLRIEKKARNRESRGKSVIKANSV